MMKQFYRLFALLIMMMGALGLGAQYAQGLFFLNIMTPTMPNPSALIN